MRKKSFNKRIHSGIRPKKLVAAMVLVCAVVTIFLCAACSNPDLPPKPEAKALRDFFDARLDNILSKLKPKLTGGRYDELNSLLCKLPKSKPDLPHLILVLNESEKVLATRTFNGPKGRFKVVHPVGYNYSKYEIINGRTAEKDTFLFCLYHSEGKLLVACRSAWDGIRFAGTVCVAVPHWGLPKGSRISERQFIDLNFTEK